MPGATSALCAIPTGSRRDVDLPLADAADVLGIPVGTMKSRLNRATAALRAALDADEREPVRLMEPMA